MINGLSIEVMTAIFVAICGGIITIVGAIATAFQQYRSLADKMQNDNREFFIKQKNEMKESFEERIKQNVTDLKDLRDTIKRYNDEKKELLQTLSKSEEAREKLKKAFEDLQEKYNKLEAKYNNLETNYKNNLTKVGSRLSVLEKK